MPSIQVMNQQIRAMVGFIVIVVSLANGLQDTSTLYPTNDSVSSSFPGETTEVHYDFLEDGVLQGGTLESSTQPADTELSTMVQTLSEPASYNSFLLVDNGPYENRVDIVFVGDGYTVEQMGLYWQHVQTIVDGMLAESPLNRYASYFNIHIVEVISNESGVDEVDNNIYRDTALDMAFDDRQLSVDYSKAMIAASNAPAMDVVVALANSSRYGGIGYTHLASVGAANASAVELVLHEFGHAFANLTDEYYPVDGSVYGGSEPTQANASTYTASELVNKQLKWYRWLDVAGVNTFEGAKLKQYGVYRPLGTTKMRTLGYPFGPVNSEQFVFRIYEFTSPIDLASPAIQQPVTSDTLFSIECQSPTTNTMKVQWRIDGAIVAGVTGGNFRPADVEEYLLPNTLQTLTVTVSDDTDLVRDQTQRDAQMTDQRQWQIWTASADIVDGKVFGLPDLEGMMFSWLTDDPAYDIAPGDGDGIVDIQDFAALAAQWNSTTMTGDGVVNLFDLEGMMFYWLTDNTACDIAPAGGDGVVDIQDFAVLAAQWTGS